jgi:hypothetical protein
MPSRQPRGAIRTAAPSSPNVLCPKATIAALKAAVQTKPAELMLVTGTRKDALAGLIRSTTKAIIEDPNMSRDNARWFRFRHQT